MWKLSSCFISGRLSDGIINPRLGCKFGYSDCKSLRLENTILGFGDHGVYVLSRHRSHSRGWPWLN